MAGTQILLPLIVLIALLSIAVIALACKLSNSVKEKRVMKGMRNLEKGSSEHLPQIMRMNSRGGSNNQQQQQSATTTGQLWPEKEEQEMLKPRDLNEIN